MSEKEIKKILEVNKVLKEENKRLRQLVAYINVHKGSGTLC